MTEVLFWKIADSWWLVGLFSLAFIAARKDFDWWHDDLLSIFLASILWPLMVSVAGTIITLAFWFVFFYEVVS